MAFRINLIRGPLHTSLILRCHLNNRADIVVAVRATEYVRLSAVEAYLQSIIITDFQKVAHIRGLDLKPQTQNGSSDI